MAQLRAIPGLGGDVAGEDELTGGVAISGRSPEAFARTAGISARDIAAIETVASWVMPAFAVFGMVADAVAFVELLSGDDPVREGFDRLERHLQGISDQITLGEHRDRLTESRKEFAKVATLAVSVQSYLDTGAADHRESLERALSDPMNGCLPMLSALADSQANQLPHAPVTYPDNPDWMSGGIAVFLYGASFTSMPTLAVGELPLHERAGTIEPLGGDRLQVLRPVTGELPQPWTSPDRLVVGKPRWDGRYHQLPLMLGSVFAQNAVQALEPYYRTTGHYHRQMVQVIDAVSGFVDDWERSLLITADMPAPPDAESPAGLAFGFDTWHCGAFDAMSGASVYEKHWWTPPPAPEHMDTPGPGGLMGQDQLDRFRSDRAECLARVRQASGLNQMTQVLEALKAAARPPDESSSLMVYDDRPQLDKNLTISSSPTTADTFNMVVPATTYEGIEENREILVRVPIAIQGDPGLDDVPNMARRAVSDVTFGYRIALGTSSEMLVFEEELRREAGEEGIWHTTQGPEHTRPVPRATEWQDLRIELPTYQCFTDPEGTRRRVEDLGPGQVNLRCRVTIGNTHHTPIPGVDEKSPQRGVLWLEVHSADATNPSFELPFVVTELTNVDPDGNPAGVEDRLRYTCPGSVTVDARVKVMPAEYHDQWEKEHKAFYKIVANINNKYTESQPIVQIGPPDDILHPTNPFEKIRDLLDNPKWSARILDDIHQVAGVKLEATTLQHGLDRLNAQRVLRTRQAPRIGRAAPTA